MERESTERTNYRLLGNGKDSHAKYSDAKYALLSKYLFESFRGDVGDPIVWSQTPQNARDERLKVSAFLGELVKMAESSAKGVRSIVRKVQQNQIPNAGGNGFLDLNDNVNKIRYLLEYYDRLTAPNEIKDSEHNKQFHALKFHQTGDLHTDVVSFFHSLLEIEDELSDHAKPSDFEKKKKCATVLSQAVPALHAAISSLNLASAAVTFDIFQQVIETACQSLQISDIPHSIERNSSSSNSTELSGGQSLRRSDVNNIVRNAYQAGRSSGDRSSRSNADYPRRGRSASKSQDRTRDRSASKSQDRTRDRSRSRDTWRRNGNNRSQSPARRNLSESKDDRSRSQSPYSRSTRDRSRSLDSYRSSRGSVNSTRQQLESSEANAYASEALQMWFHDST